MNATKMLGIAACLLAGFFCLRAALRLRGTDRGRALFWFTIAAFQVLFTLEVLLSARQLLRDSLQALLEGESWYDERYQRLWPFLLLGAVVAVLAVIGMVLAVRARRRLGRPEQLAIAGTALTGIMLVVPVVSFTAIDRILYFETGPFLLIAWLWAAGAACSALGSIMAPRAAATRR